MLKNVLFALLLALPALARPTAAPKLDRAFIRATHPGMADADFEAKWRNALASPVLFIRSYPAAFHKLLAGGQRPIGPEGLCLGDAHPGNFGWLLLEGKTKFAYNDLDDSGRCPIANDALRYFTALSLFFGDDELVADVVEKYVDVIKDAGRASDVPKSLRPDWGKVAKKGLEKVTRGDKLVDDEARPASAVETQGLLAAIKADARLRGSRIIDVAAIAREAGGSGGLKRYWLLAERSGKRTVIELKQAGRPGVEWGASTRKLSMDERLPLLKKAFWGARAEGDYFYVKVAGTHFLVRDRFTKKSLDVLELSGKDRNDVLRAQASAMALLHADGFRGIKKDDLRAWLLAKVREQAAIWRAAYAAARR